MKLIISSPFKVRDFDLNRLMRGGGRTLGEWTRLFSEFDALRSGRPRLRAVSSRMSAEGRRDKINLLHHVAHAAACGHEDFIQRGRMRAMRDRAFLHSQR